MQLLQLSEQCEQIFLADVRNLIATVRLDFNFHAINMIQGAYTLELILWRSGEI